MLIAQIQPSDFHTWLAAQTSPVTVLDVRESWEVQTASITPNGFVLKHIPMNDTPARLEELDSNHLIACLCHHGARSQRVASYLAQNGFTHLVNIAGGIAAWAQTVDSSIPQY